MYEFGATASCPAGNFTALAAGIRPTLPGQAVCEFSEHELFPIGSYLMDVELNPTDAVCTIEGYDGMYFGGWYLADCSCFVVCQ